MILWRLRPLDNDVIVETYAVDMLDTNLTKIGTHYYTGIDSTLMDAQIISELAIATTVAEFTAIARNAGSRENAKTIPNWSTWTETEVLAWLATNIGTPLLTPIPANPMTVQQIRAVLVNIVNIINKQYDAEKSMARMVVALRDNTWPDLGNV